MKVWDCLPQIAQLIPSFDDIREIRIRNGRPVKVNCGGRWYGLGKRGFTDLHSGILPNEDCDEIVRRACNNSVYTYEKMLTNGYLTLEDGVRIGVCGEVAGEAQPMFRKYTSICLRIPHCRNVVDGKTFGQCSAGNIVVIGPPASGKTTFLRDLAIKLSNTQNVLVADERGELFYDDVLRQGVDCDVLKWCSKSYAFNIGVRAISPQWIVCDEVSPDDVAALRNVAQSGVKIACSAHGESLGDFEAKFSLADLFDVFVVLGRVGEKTVLQRQKQSNNSEYRQNIE